MCTRIYSTYTGLSLSRARLPCLVFRTTSLYLTAAKLTFLTTGQSYTFTSARGPRGVGGGGGGGGRAGKKNEGQDIEIHGTTKRETIARFRKGRERGLKYKVFGGFAITKVCMS